MDLSEMRHLYGDRVVDDLLDLQRSIYERGLRPVDFSGAARRHAESTASKRVAAEISARLGRL
jgi:hypothetical protein